MPATFPGGVKQFVMFKDQPGPDALTIPYAVDMNEIHDEVKAVEVTLGSRPLAGTPYTTFTKAFTDLYNRKAASVHFHPHIDMQDGDKRYPKDWSVNHPPTPDDHPQYMPTDAHRAFTSPIGGVAATDPHHLARLDQISSFGFITTSQFNSLLNSAVTKFATGKNTGGTGLPLLPSPGSNWRLTGGFNAMDTDFSGQAFVSFGGAFTSWVQSIVFIRMPVPGGGGFGLPAFQYMEDQILLSGVTLAGFTVRFSEDFFVIRNRTISFTWIALGI